MDRLTAMLGHIAYSCCNGREKSMQSKLDATEKTPNSVTTTAAKQAAQDTVDRLQYTDKPGRDLQVIINDIVAQAGGWSEYIAKAILRLLEAVIRAGAPMGATLREAYNKSCEAAEELTTFAKDHPILCTVIALGILAMLTPAVISALGFTAEGVVEGSFAAAWQSTYGGFVEAGSWFSYFQKLGTIVG